MSTGLGASAFERIASFFCVPGAAAAIQLGTTTDVFTGGAYSVTLDVVGLEARVRITGTTNVIAWQIAVDVLEGGLNAANAGWTNG